MGKLVCAFFTAAVLMFGFAQTSFARCDYPDDLDSAGRRCGGRAASVIPGGRLGGDGRYQDSQGRNRLYGTNNDPYDTPKSGQPRGGYQQPFGR
jgi:hypothetical protein